MTFSFVIIICNFVKMNLTDHWTKLLRTKLAKRFFNFTFHCNEWQISLKERFRCEKLWVMRELSLFNQSSKMVTSLCSLLQPRIPCLVSCSERTISKPLVKLLHSLASYIYSYLPVCLANWPLANAHPYQLMLNIFQPIHSLAVLSTSWI